MKLYQYISYIFIILIYFKCNVTYVSIIFKAKFDGKFKITAGGDVYFSSKFSPPAPFAFCYFGGLRFIRLFASRLV